jgi:hypothetical protein
VEGAARPGLFVKALLQTRKIHCYLRFESRRV